MSDTERRGSEARTAGRASAGTRTPGDAAGSRPGAYYPCHDASVSHRMAPEWHGGGESAVLVTEATFDDQARLVGRVGISMLSVGTGAWRVIESMNAVARKLSLSCTVDAGLTSISYTCSRGAERTSASYSLPTTGVNTDRLDRLSRFVREFCERDDLTLAEAHAALDEICSMRGNYTPLQAGISSGAACAAFTFLLGGGPVEMLVSLVGAFVGNWVSRHLIDRRVSLVPNVMASVALACLAAVCGYLLLERLFGLSPLHESAYACAMLFIIPGFPLITGGIDLAKSDMRSGIERITYALVIITTATFTGWVVATLAGFTPDDLQGVALDPLVRALLRLAMSFVGVFGFSQMFNSTPRMAATAASIGAVSNTLRLELVDLAGCAPSLASFLGALVAGLLASAVQRRVGYPRISLTVPSIVIMVPGLYMYRAVYNLALGNSADGASWLFNAAFMVLALPLGLIVARALTDRRFRTTV